MSSKDLIEQFKDTQRRCFGNPLLREAIAQTRQQTKFYSPDVYPLRSSRANEGLGNVVVTRNRTFEAVLSLHKQYPGAKIAALNFASATTPGGGVTQGATAQEECLCRCSTLYPCLNTPSNWEYFYDLNRAIRNPLHTDKIIYTPGVVICKTDDLVPLSDDQLVSVDIITCAAPNLRGKPSNRYNDEGTDQKVEISDEVLYAVHVKRAKHILDVAKQNGVDILVLGAFGCGAFKNNPQIVARAYRDAIQDLGANFKEIEFAVYCRDRDAENYEVFKEVLG